MKGSVRDAIVLTAEGYAFSFGMVIGGTVGALFLRWVWHATEKR